MPAPLGKTPTKKMPKIEVFGLEGSQSTRAAVRFFRERRIVVRYVDLGKRPIDPAELRQFMDRLGAAAFLDSDLTTDRRNLLAASEDTLPGRTSSNNAMASLCIFSII